MTRRATWSGLAWAAPALVAAAAVYFGAIHGDFVYDDQRQIVRNTLIQDPDRTLEALGSDVWAFKGGRGSAVSDYWRPSFVAWLIGNHRLFGLESTTGWHAGNLVLHTLATGLLFLVARRFGAERPVAAAVALVFAVHPAHAESVAWISGAPDLLLAVALLGTLALVPGLAREGGAMRWCAALLLFALALGAKEVALLTPLVVAVAVKVAPGDGSVAAPTGSKPRRALVVAAPFAVVATAWFFARWAVLGRLLRPPSGGASLAETLLTAPAAFAFYLRQSIAPLAIGPSYPLRAVGPAELDPGDFWLPLGISLAALAAAFALARRIPIARLGLALWLAPLAPAFSFGAFHPEQLVHDRYLYLPLAGLLLLVAPAAVAGLERAGLTPARAGRTLLAAAVLLAVPLGLQAWNAGRVWTSDVALWERGVRTDPTSAFNQLELGAALEAEKRYDEARAALDRSIELHPIPNAYVARARVAVGQGRFDDAERDLGTLLRGEAGAVDPYTLYQAWEALAIGSQQQGRPDRAARALEAARRSLPIYSAALTEKLAIALYQQGLKAEALRELEAHRDAARRELLPESRLVLYRLGLLYSEQGRVEDARGAFHDYLAATESLSDPSTRRIRARVTELLERNPR